MHPGRCHTLPDTRGEEGVMAYRPIDREVRSRALALLADGMSMRAIGRELGVHHTTVAWWRDGGGTREARVAGRVIEIRTAELVPWARARPRQRDAWAYLFGVYLGDGYIDPAFRLRIFCDESYPGIINEVERAMRRVGVTRVWHLRQPGCRVVTAPPSRWDDWLPTGDGAKHTYALRWSDWHGEALRSRPHLVLRGLIHSDGCRFLNRVVVNGKGYSYPCYSFSNRSEQIHSVFEDACARLGVRPTVTGAGIGRRVARREAVELLDLFIGSKR